MEGRLIEVRLQSVLQIDFIVKTELVKLRLVYWSKKRNVRLHKCTKFQRKSISFDRRNKKR